jgi:PIN domain nuclease of toxin-antitoxin system
VIYIDTHVAVWLYSGETSRLSEKARVVAENEDLLVSPALVFETQYLYESQRILVEAPVIIEYLESALGLGVCGLSFHQAVMEALSMDWTRDPFDRLIVGHARAADRQLVTKDRNILKNYEKAVW